jgi:hypothetical protein
LLRRSVDSGRSAGWSIVGQKSPGQRGEHIAAGLRTDTKALRGPMKRLIEAGQVRTKGERRGMQYWAG